jgi:hypothetical protein
MQNRPPAHESLVQDLRLLRERGLLRIRTLELPALAAAVESTSGGARAGSADEIERLLRTAISALGDGESGLAAAYLFGVVQGTIGRRPTDLRERAAQEYGRLSPETFRKGPERRLISRLADEILRLQPGDSRPAPARGPASAREPASARGPAPAREPVAPSSGELPEVVLDLERALAETRTSDENQYTTARYGPYPCAFGDLVAPIQIRVGKIEHLTDVDVVVSSENVYIEPARMFTATLSGALRRAAAERDEAGVVVRDVVYDELRSWVTDHGSPGQPVEPGIVVPTSSGALGGQGIRRIYHAAVAVPKVGTHEYTVTWESVARSVHSVFDRLRAERDRFSPPLRSVSLPLFGAGYGRIDVTDSWNWLWRSLRAELARDGEWEVHLTALTAPQAVAILRGLLDEQSE